MVTLSESVTQIDKSNVDELSMLSEVDSEEKIIETDQLAKPKENEHLFAAIQISFLAAGFGSIFLNHAPHIMNKICLVFNNCLSLSPSLIQSPIYQICINAVLAVPLFGILLSFLIMKVGLLTNMQINKPIKFFAKHLISVTPIYLLHFGESFGYYMDVSTKENYIALFSAIFTYLMYILAFGALNNMKVIDFHEKSILYYTTLQIPMFAKFYASVCKKLINRQTGSISFNVCIWVISLLIAYFIAVKGPFVEKEWNKRAISTIAGYMTFCLVNLINFFYPDASSYSLTFGFVFVCFCIIGECGKLPPISLKKRLKKIEKRQAYSEGCDDGTAIAPHRPFIKVEVQDIVALVFFFSAILTMTYFNAMAARVMPTGEPLPDFIHDAFNIGKEIRSAPAFKQMQFSNLICVVQIIALFLITAIAPEVTNTRKIFIVYGVMCFVRTTAFFVTSMPAPCSGLPNCPCGEIEELNKLRILNPLKIALTWTFGFGMFAKLPQCGDLIVSGHTMFMWMTFKWIFQTLRRMVKKSTAKTVRTICVFLFLIAITYITLARNHYTVDIWFGFVIAEFCFDLYSVLEDKVNTADNSVFVRGMRWVENRTFPLNKMDYEEEEIEETLIAQNEI